MISVSSQIYSTGGTNYLDISQESFSDDIKILLESKVHIAVSRQIYRLRFSLKRFYRLDI